MSPPTPLRHPRPADTNYPPSIALGPQRSWFINRRSCLVNGESRTLPLRFTIHAPRFTNRLPAGSATGQGEPMSIDPRRPADSLKGHALRNAHLREHALRRAETAPPLARILVTIRARILGLTRLEL